LLLLQSCAGAVEKSDFQGRETITVWQGWALGCREEVSLNDVILEMNRA